MPEMLDLASWKAFLDGHKDVKNTGVSDKLRDVKTAKDAFDKSKKVANSVTYRKRLSELSVAVNELKAKILKQDPSQIALKPKADAMMAEAVLRTKALQKWESEQAPDQPVAQAAQAKAEAKDTTCAAAATDCMQKIAHFLTLMSKLNGSFLIPQRGGAPTWKNGIDPAPAIADINAYSPTMIDAAQKLVKKDEKLTPKDAFRANFIHRFTLIATYCKVFHDHAHAPQLIFRAYKDLQNECESGEIREYLDNVKIRYGS